MSPPLTALGTASIAIPAGDPAPAAGQLPVFSDRLYLSPSPFGTAGDILTSQGPGLPPLFQPAAGASGLSLSYRFSTSLTPPVSTQYIELDAAHPYSSVAHLNASTTTDGGTDVHNYLLVLAIGTRLYLQERSDSSRYTVVKITAAPVDHTTYVEVPVAWEQSGPSPLTNNAPSVLTVLPAPTSPGGITQLTGPVTAGPGSGSQATTITPTGVSAGSFGDVTHVPSFTVNAAGQLTAASQNDLGLWVDVPFSAGNYAGMTVAAGNVQTHAYSRLGNLLAVAIALTSVTIPSATASLVVAFGAPGLLASRIVIGAAYLYVGGWELGIAQISAAGVGYFVIQRAAQTTIPSGGAHVYATILVPI